MQIDEKLEYLEECLKKAKEKKKSLRKTTREQYYVFELLIKHYEKEIKNYKQKLKVSS